MTLGELISKIEEASGTSITDPTLLTTELMVGDDMGEHHITGVDLDGDVVVLMAM